MGIFEYREAEQIKDNNNDVKYFKQIMPFTWGKMFNDEVSIREYGNSVIFYSKDTKNCLGTSDVMTKKLFMEV